MTQSITPAGLLLLCNTPISKRVDAACEARCRKAVQKESCPDGSQGQSCQGTVPHEVVPEELNASPARPPQARCGAANAAPGAGAPS